MRRSTRTTITVGGVAATALTLSLGAVVLTANQSSADVSVGSASQLLQDAVAVSQQVVVPQGLSSSAAARPDATVLARTQTVGRAHLSTYFAGSALAGQEHDLDNSVIQEEAPDFVVLGGGASDFAVTHTSETAQSVEIQARVDVWSQIGQIQHGKVVQARPENTILVTATVTRTAAGLRITKYAWKFAPGSSP
jgi:hypothetical protein